MEKPSETPGVTEPTKKAVSAELVVVRTTQGAVSHAELKTVFKRAAWYSLALTVAVAILGELTPYILITRRLRRVRSADPDVLLALRLQQGVLYVLGFMHDVSYPVLLLVRHA